MDTIYGVTYAVVAPEHPIVDEILKANPVIKSAVMAMKNMDVIERAAEGKEKWNRYRLACKNPYNGVEVPLWIGDYVLMNYGTGAVMAVPAHDERDYAFAKNII